MFIFINFFILFILIRISASILKLFGSLLYFFIFSSSLSADRQLRRVITPFPCSDSSSTHRLLSPVYRISWTIPPLLYTSCPLPCQKLRGMAFSLFPLNVYILFFCLLNTVLNFRLSRFQPPPFIAAFMPFLSTSLFLLFVFLSNIFCLCTYIYCNIYKYVKGFCVKCLKNC